MHAYTYIHVHIHACKRYNGLRIVQCTLRSDTNNFTLLRESLSLYRAIRLYSVHVCITVGELYRWTIYFERHRSHLVKVYNFQELPLKDRQRAEPTRSAIFRKRRRLWFCVLYSPAVSRQLGVRFPPLARAIIELCDSPLTYLSLMVAYGTMTLICCDGRRAGEN